MSKEKNSIAFSLQTLVNELSGLLAVSILANHKDEGLTAAEIHHSIVGLFSEAAQNSHLKLPPSILYPLMKQLSQDVPLGDGLVKRMENKYEIASDAASAVLPEIERALLFADKLVEYLREAKKQLQVKKERTKR